MRIQKRITVLFLLAAFLTSTFTALFICLHDSQTNHHLQLAVCISVIIVLIVIADRIIWYQLSLKRAVHNLDEAQQLANLGSWERDLVTGVGYWSKNHYRLFGLQPLKKAPSMDEFFTFIHPADRESARETVLEAIKSGGSYEIRYRLDKDINNRFFLSRGKVLSDDSGKPLSIVGTIQDITEKQLQEKFRDKLLKQKDLFITRLGHDLRTPLTPLVALLPLIRSKAVDQRQLGLIDICVDSVDHIKELITSTIQLARLSSFPALPPARFNVRLSPLVDSCIADMTDTRTSKGITIENLIPPDIVARADIQQIENVLQRLICNALKYSPPSSRISINAKMQENLVTVTVADNGIGLAEEELSHIFEELYKADPSRHELGSSGLGLSICRRIIELHGGRMWAESPGVGYGTSIIFTLEAGGAI